MRTALRALIVALAFLALLPLSASAHPLGNFTVNRYSAITVGSDGLTLRYVLDLAEIPTLQELGSAGIDPAASSAEVSARLLAAKTAELSSGAQLTLSGRTVTWSSRDASLELIEGQAGLRTMRVALTFVATDRLADGSALAYHDANYAGRIGWHEIVLRGGIVDSSVPAQDVTDELRVYPTDPAIAPLDRDRAIATVRLGTAAGASNPTPSAGGARFAVDATIERLTGVLRDERLDALSLIAALLVAAALGAVHALGPGHGKALVGAYLVGSRGTARHALLLGATVTATHTAGVYLLGLGTLLAARYVLPDRIYPILGMLSGALVIAIGLGLGRSRIAALRHAHAHARPGGHGHSHEHGHADATGDHGQALSLRGLLGLGVSGGLLPCPTALVVLLAAVSFHNVALGMVLVAAFSVGLAAVLTGIGLALVWGGRWLTRSGAARRVGAWGAVAILPVLSAAAIAVAGALIAIDAARAIV
jgi:nickel/cobalt exporter